MPFQILRRPDVPIAHTKKQSSCFFAKHAYFLAWHFDLFSPPPPYGGASFVFHLSKTFSSKHLIISFATCTAVFNSRFSVSPPSNIMTRWGNEYVDIEDEKKKGKERKNITLSSSSSFPLPFNIQGEDQRWQDIFPNFHITTNCGQTDTLKNRP